MKTAAMWLPLLVVCSLSSWSSVVAETNNDISVASIHFAKDVVQILVKNQPGNVIVSPISISSLLAMLQQGARNETAKQLESVLHVDADKSKAGFGHLVQTFMKRKYKSKLDFTNTIFANNNFEISNRYKTALHKGFNSGVELVNFGDSIAAAKLINGKISYSTNKRITDLITPESISARTQMILVNTIHFKGVWRHLFPENQTVDEEFTLNSGRKVTVPMMKLKTLLPAGNDDNLGARWIELPYDGFDFSMIIVLPIKRLGLDAVIKRLTHESFSGFMDDLHTKDVTLKMPRFKLNQEVPIVPALKELGLVDLFDQRSNLQGVSNAGTPLLVSDIIHKAEIEVNEQGTEASASSVFFAQTLSFTPEPEEEDVFVDQPFLVIIVDTENKLPLFIARVTNPTE